MLMWIYQQHPWHRRLHHVFPSACAKPLKATLLSPINLIMEIGSVVSSYFQFILQLLGCKCHEQMLAFNNKSEHFESLLMLLDIFRYLSLWGNNCQKCTEYITPTTFKEKKRHPESQQKLFFFELSPEPAINNFFAPNVGGFFIWLGNLVRLFSKLVVKYYN